MKATILKLVILNHLDDTEWTNGSQLQHYFNNAANFYQFMEKLRIEQLIETEKRVAMRTNGRPTLMSVYRLTNHGLSTLKESKVYLLREVISDCHGACMGT